jgi:hypothetical protein
VRLRVIGALREISDSYARLIDAQTGAAVKPILLLLCGRLAPKKQQAERENTNANAA